MGKIRSLVTNYRTHPLLVEATNQFLTMKSKTMNPEENKEGLFMDERISFIESKGHLENADEKLFRREARDLPHELRIYGSAGHKLIVHRASAAHARRDACEHGWSRTAAGLRARTA